MMVRKTDEQQELWNEIRDTDIKATHIKAHRDAEWYLRALRLLLEAALKLLDGFVNTITAWRAADELRNGGDPDA